VADTLYEYTSIHTFLHTSPAYQRRATTRDKRN